MKIRQAFRSDSKRILELLAELGRPEPKGNNDSRKFRYLIERYLDSKKRDCSILVAIIDSRIVGLVSYILLDRLNQRLGILDSRNNSFRGI